MKYSVIISLLILGNAGCSYTMNNANGRKASAQVRQQAVVPQVMHRASRINQINSDARLAELLQNEEWDVPMANSFRIDEESRAASIDLARRLQQEEQAKIEQDQTNNDAFLARLMQQEYEQQIEDEALARLLQEEEQL